MYDTYMFGVFPLGRSSILWRFDSARSIRQTGIHKIAFSKNSQKSYKRNIFNMKIVLRRAWKDAFNELSHVYMCAIWKIDWRLLVESVWLYAFYSHMFLKLRQFFNAFLFQIPFCAIHCILGTDNNTYYYDSVY